MRPEIEIRHHQRVIERNDELVCHKVVRHVRLDELSLHSRVAVRGAIRSSRGSVVECATRDRIVFGLRVVNRSIRGTGR